MCFNYLGDLEQDIKKPGEILLVVERALLIKVVVDNVSIPQPKNIKRDWGNHWARYEIQKAICRDGFLATMDFRPNDDIPRAEVLKALTMITSIRENADEPFIDTNPADWYYPYVRMAIANEIISPDKYFRPNDKITREEFAVMISNLKTGKQWDKNHDVYSMYVDYNEASDWAKDSIE